MGMRIKVPITGELREDLSGNPDNPVKPINLTKLAPGVDCSWEAINYDYETGFVEIELTFQKKTIVTAWDTSKDPPERIAWRNETDAEFAQRQADGEAVLRGLSKRTAKELFAITKETELIKPAKLALR